MSPMLASASHGFWSSSLADVVVVVVIAVLVGATAAIVNRRRFRGGGVRERIREFVARAAAASETEEPASGGLLSRTERSLEQEGWWHDFSETLELAGVERPAIEVVFLIAGCTIFAAVFLGVLLGTPIAALLALVAVPFAARSGIKWQLRRQRILFGEQLPAHLQELAAALRVGHSMISGIGVMADVAAEPTRGEFRRVVADEQLGMPLEDALRSLARRMDAQDIEQVALVAALHRQTGGNMADVLDRVAESVRERAELNRELRTLTAQARGSRWVVTLMPPALLLIIVIVNERYADVLLKTSSGHILLVVAAALVATGSAVMGRIVRIEV